MTGFRVAREDDGTRLVWVGNPDDETAHKTILAWLKSAVTSGFIGQDSTISNGMKGSLGEFIAYKIGEGYVFTNGEIAITANAWAPLSDISRPDLDIVWLYFGTTAADDWAAIQEVKTTGQSSLNLADGLISDYDKLFGENLKLTLRTRLDGLKSRLEQMQNGSQASRITALGGPDAERSRGIYVVPTLVHDAEHDAADKLTIVRQALIGNGWAANVVQCWSVKLGGIDDRLTRLARGHT